MRTKSGPIRVFLAFSSLPDGIILSKSSSHLDFDTISKCSWLQFAVDYIKLKTENQIVISVPGVSPKDVLRAQVSGLDLICKEFDTGS